ncbi:MAG: DUF3427 domain-containing protein, partial [Fimbriimonas sp.]|nr:DUF3427 domain-containing protein [Fimbriimonas sp.]
RANGLLDHVEANNAAESALLTAISQRTLVSPADSLVPLSQSALITNDQGINYHRMLRSELLSADRVDLVCPFIGNQGLNLLIDLLQDLGSNLRIITTTYLGGTHARALERLSERGARIKIVYERPDQKTALHAKAWIFHRESGFTTATLGSSNLSPKALVDGLEWNIRLGTNDAPQVLQELIITFDRLWADPLYETFDQTRDGDRLRSELRANRTGDGDGRTEFFADVVARPHQEEALDALRYARLDGRNRNLIVAATGTGKTLISAFDYERLARGWGGRPTILFIAHRADILKQSLGAFRAVLRDATFGEVNVGDQRASGWRHTFASVQSSAFKRLDDFDPEHFDVIVIDEFHHAEARTYARIVDHFRPKQLLGLTATPERTDGRRQVIESLWPPTFELRLWHALERRLLCPFHYFGVDDGTDLSSLRWSEGKYDVAELEAEYVDRGDERARLVVRELRERTEADSLRAVAFCSSQRHAEFMADRFRQAGYKARALHAGQRNEDRSLTVREFRTGQLPIVCTVDLFNEGVDVPEINTVLFLRPTESATLFIQQLGRGLRNHYDKGALTVLDFVGQQNKKFRMDLRFRSMTGLSRTELEQAIKSGFPTLPPGCDIRLDKVTTERVLRNIRQAIPSDLPQLAAEARRLAVGGRSLTVGQFLTETGLEPSDLYAANRSFTQVLQNADLWNGDLPERHYRVGALAHADDRFRLEQYRSVVRETTYDDRFRAMLAFPVCRQADLAGLADSTRDELSQLLDYLYDASSSLPPIADDLPFSLHARYTRDEIVTPFGINPVAMREGVFLVRDMGLHVKLVTLRKSNRSFSPTTRYHDFFEAPSLLHWESQSTTRLGSPTGQMLVHDKGRHLFFVREDRDDPFHCLGFGHVISHESERPIRIRWGLDHPVPDHVYVRFARAAG